MTALAREKVFDKLEHLREYLGYLQLLRQETNSEDVFLADFHLFGNVERYLQLSIQAIIDITHLLIIDMGKRRPQDNYEAISLLFESKVVNEELAHSLTAMVGLRNILVHEYGKIDRKKVYVVLTQQLQDLEDFQWQVLRYLET